MAAKLQHPRQAVANDRGAQVAHMHFLGDVGAGEIHQHRRGHLHRRYPQPGIAQAAADFDRQLFRPKAEVDEAWASDLGRFPEVVESWICR